MIRVPDNLLVKPFQLRSLKIDGCTIFESCTHEANAKNSMLVAEHLLVFVLAGTYKATFGNHLLKIRKGEGLVVQRTHQVEYEKEAMTDVGFESLMFFLKDDLIRKFLLLKDIGSHRKFIFHPVLPISVSPAMQSFLSSMKMYFNSSLSFDPKFLRIKLFELLYKLTESNKNLLQVLDQHFEMSYTKNVLALNEKLLTTPMEISYLTDCAPLSENKFKSPQPNDKPVDLIVLFKVKDGNQDRFIKQFQNSVYYSRPEAGNIAFHIHAVNNDNTTFVLYERWRTQEALDFHFAQPYTKELFTMFRDVLDRPVEESIHYITELKN